MSNNQTEIAKDPSNKKLVVTREFDAPVDTVWRAWTDSALLDEWWAPKPWKTNTKSMDFRTGGMWLYYMEGPNGERHYCRADYTNVEPQKSFTGDDSFCDENGNITNTAPGMNWYAQFSESDKGTKVVVEITFASEADMETIIAMGFKEGFTMAHGNLDELLAKQYAN
jgi:uncharacterized protein YndB with AHSA1/START domain